MRTDFRPLMRACLLALAAAASSVAAQTWPEIKLPANARSQVIASQMLFNGKPCRLIRFDVRASDTEVLAFYRAEFGGGRVVENRVKGHPVIATRQGEYFVTVQLHVLDGATLQGTVMMTLLTAVPASSAALVDTQNVFPSDTKVVSTVQTDDAGKRSLVVTGVNRNSARANRDHIMAAMRERGFKPTSPDPSPDDSHSPLLSLHLSSAAEEASVTISDAGPYRAVVINRVRTGQ